MQIFKNLLSIYGFIFFSTLTTVGCDQKSSAPPQKTAMQMQVEKVAVELLQKEHEEQIAKLETELQKVKPERIRSMLSACQSSILELAKSENTSPFAVFLVDEYSADVYQAASYAGGGNVSSESERIKKFIRARKDGEKNLQYALDLSYTVMFTRESFSGSEKEPRRYSCHIEPDMTVKAIWSDMVITMKKINRVRFDLF